MIRYARWLYAGWLVLTSLAIVVQLYLAGYGVFGFSGLSGFRAHLFVGDVIGFAILVSLGLAFAARASWKVTGLNGVLVVLMAVQFVLAHAGVQIVSALHVVNGVLILLLTLYVTRESITLALKKAPEPRPAATAIGATART